MRTESFYTTGEEKSDQYGKQLGLKIAAVGLGIALAFTGLIGILQAYLAEFPLVVIGAVLLVLSCGWFSGGYAARWTYQGKSPYLNGLGAALFTVAAPTLAISLPFALATRSLEHFWLVLLAPLYIILLYGAIPMIILGVVFGLMLDNFVKDADPSPERF